MTAHSKAGATLRTPAAVAVVVALAVALFSLSTVETLPVGLLPVIAADLDVSRSAVGLLVTGYGVVVAVASVPLTHLARRAPRRALLIGLLVLFVLANLVSAAAPGYWVLLAARITVALTHAVFWSIVAATAAGLFPPEVRGRVVAGLFSGLSLAGVVGVPAGTWLGQQFGWRVPFVVMSAFGFLALVTVTALLPSTALGGGHASVGAEPSARRFAVLMVTTALVICGVFTGYTYITAFLTDVTGFSQGAVAPLLLASGIAGIAGTYVAGAFVDRHPRHTMVLAVGLLTATMLGLYLFGGARPAAVCLVALLGFSMASMTTSLQSRILQVAPGSTEIASAVGSAVFNVGIAGGSLLGGLLLPTALGVEGAVLVGGVLAVGALAVLLGEPWVARREKPRADRRPSPVSAA
ncbi:MFS transporter [Streptomyces megasporus]|uniref:MFS transporter n=1 Tax=Streptomyces megasporus TaxID=44060 RepID=UPI000AB88462|nr:MFS transporter [Streptomyces megasporus]